MRTSLLPELDAELSLAATSAGTDFRPGRQDDDELHTAEMKFLAACEELQAAQAPEGAPTPAE